jgi:uncharacterized membrane protein
MSICARCFGCTIGHLMAITLMTVGSLPSIDLAVLGILIMMIDWYFQEFFEIVSSNPRRFITGIVGGLGVGALIWTPIQFAIYSMIAYLRAL